MENQQFALDGLGSCGIPYKSSPWIAKALHPDRSEVCSPPHPSSLSQLQGRENNSELKLVKIKYAKNIYAQFCSQRCPAS